MEQATKSFLDSNSGVFSYVRSGFHKKLGNILITNVSQKPIEIKTRGFTSSSMPSSMVNSPENSQTRQNVTDFSS